MSSPRQVTGHELIRRYGHDGPPSELATDPPQKPPLEEPDLAADLAAEADRAKRSEP